MFDNSFEQVLTDIPKLRFLDFDEEGVEVQANTMEVKGKDGVMMGPSTFGPFNLVLRFFYTGADTETYNLLKQRLRGLLFRRNPYYITHSDMPGKKYAVYCSENAIEDIGEQYGTFEISFVVFKGYSESLSDTLDTEFLTENWQFGSNLLSNGEMKYKHDRGRFSIWNGSNDAISPLEHKLIIRISADAPNGFKMINHHTDEEFVYTGSLNKSQTLVLNGVHPIIDKTRVGIDTNYSWITLAEGENNIEITGNGISNVSAEFEFNFIYR